MVIAFEVVHWEWVDSLRATEHPLFCKLSLTWKIQQSTKDYSIEWVMACFVMINCEIRYRALCKFEDRLYIVNGQRKHVAYIWRTVLNKCPK